MPINATNYYPYASGAGSSISETQWRNFMGKLAPSAVLRGQGNELNPFGDSTGLQVKVDTGQAWVRGDYGEWTTGVSTLPIASVGGIAGGSSRVDRIVCRNDFVNKWMTLDVLTGTAGVSPSPPTLTQSSSMWEVLLADVGPLVNTTTTITAAMVIDGRWKMTESGVLYHERVLSAATGSIVIPANAGTTWGPGAQGIPTGYRTAIIEADSLLSDQASVQAINATFNGDTGTNYDADIWAPGETKSVGVANVRVAAAPLSTAAGRCSFVLEIPGYSQTSVWRQFFSRAVRADASGTILPELNWGIWRNAAAAISYVTLTPAAGNIQTGGRFLMRMDP